MNKINNNANNKNDKEILNLKIELKKANNIIEQQKTQISQLQNELNNLKENYHGYIQTLQDTIDKKEEELTKLKDELAKKKTDFSKNKSTYCRDNMMTVNFISMDHKVLFAVPCVEDDIFAEVEEKLYKEFPEYRETNNYFLANGIQVLRFKTIAQNNIGNGRPVTLVVP